MIFSNSFIFADTWNNDNCWNAEAVTVPYNSSGSVGKYDKNDYYSFIAPSDGTVSIQVTGSWRDMDAYLYNQNCTQTLGADASASNNPVISTIPVLAGQTYKVRLAYWPNGGSTNYNLSIQFQPNSATPTGGIFPIRKSLNLTGNMKVIGNTVLCPKNGLGQCVESGTNISNADVNLRFIDIDSDGTTFNSSSATLVDPAIIPTAENPNPARVKWAGLYWTGYLSNSNYTQTQASNLINNHTVKLSIDDSSYVNISSYTVLGTAQNGSYLGTSYGCFADVTNLLQDKDPRAIYRVADIPSTQGATNPGDGLGNSGAWTLVVIYENDSAGEKTRNTTVFDGFVRVFDIDGNSNNGAQAANDKIINLSGFKTPKTGSVDSTLSVFANEGDRYILGDQFRFTSIDGDKAGQTKTLSSASGINNFFNSSITGVNTRIPNIINNNGIDIHTDQLGTTGENVVSTNQTKASITLTTSQDTYFPIMVAFATELYKPKLCYDFAGFIGDHIRVPIASDRTFDVTRWDDNEEYPFYIKAFIRSEEADFDLINTGLKVVIRENNGSIMSDSKLDFDMGRTYVSPNSTNGYDLAIPMIGDMFSIGENNSITGGTIGINENTYAKAAFQFRTPNLIEGYFDLEVHTSIQLDANNSIPYTYNTNDPDSLPMCERNYIYDPIWLYFNVEPRDSNMYTDPVDKYSLLTQIAGRPFDVDVVSYSGAPTYTTEQTIDGVTVDLELINAGGFENNSSVGYDSICSDSDNKITDGQFITFKNQSRVHYSDVNTDSFISDTALENAAFRVWVLTKTDDNGTSVIVDHECEDADDEDCFQGVYIDNYYDANATTGNYCDNQCNISGGSTESGCYECLKKYYATPICSRDNFAIRPKAFRAQIFDTNESTTADTTSLSPLVSNDGNVNSNSATLAAGYKYFLNLNALAFDDTTSTPGYYNERFEAQSLFISTATAPQNAVTLLFDDDVQSCNDINSTTYNYIFRGGMIGTYKNANQEFSFSNVGNYQYSIDDSNWTRVDQKDYEYKTTFDDKANDDCDKNSTNSPAIGKVGCSTGSIITNETAYNIINLQFNPYGFNLDDVHMINAPDNQKSWLYTNNLRDDPEMGVRFDGNVTAVAKDGAVTNNFVIGCAATNVNLDLNITSTPKAGEIIALHTDDYNNTKHINLNNVIKDINGSFSDYNSTVSIISSTAFLRDNNGSSAIDLRYNYDRENDMVTNPILATFNYLKAEAPDANASAHMDNNRTPDGNVTYDQNRTFLKGRVYTAAEDTMPVTHDGINSVDFKVLAYCDKNSDLNCSTLDYLANSPIVNWYYVVDHTSSTDDGNITKLDDSVGVSYSKQHDIGFGDDLNASSETIYVSYPTEDGDKTVIVTVYPNEWLRYQIDDAHHGYPFFVLKFLGSVLNNDWTGVGETGNRIDINASKGSEGRTSW